MLSTLQFRILTALGITAIVLVIANAALVLQNRSAQLELNSRQQFVQQTSGLEVLYRDIVKSLAELAVKNKDGQVLQMLAAQGINVSVNNPPGSPAGPNAGSSSAAAPAAVGTPKK